MSGNIASSTHFKRKLDNTDVIQSLSHSSDNFDLSSSKPEKVSRDFISKQENTSIYSLSAKNGEGVTSNAPSASSAVEGLPKKANLISVYAERKGEREEMQDRHLVIDSFSVPVKDIKRSAFYALFDGHGGKLASEFCAQKFPDHLSKAFSKLCTLDVNLFAVEKLMKRILTETYKSIDDDFLSQALKHKPPLKDGSTACTIILLDNILYCANIGDTKAVVCRRKQETKDLIAMPLTIDHHPQNFNERMRIQKSGGMVKDGRVMGVLEVSRSIGDGPMKAHGVICLPDIKKLSLTPNDLFLILACDGLWKVFCPQSAVVFILDKYIQYRLKSDYKDDDKLLWIRISDDICAEAVLRGCGDNVSVILIVFGENCENIPI